MSAIQTPCRVSFLNKLAIYTKARLPLFHVETPELKELKSDLVYFAKSKKQAFFYYTVGILRCEYYQEHKDRDVDKENFNRQQRNQECSVDEFIYRLITEPNQKDIAKTSIPENCIILASGITSVLDGDLAQRVVEAAACDFFKDHKITLILTDSILEVPDKLLMYSTPIQYELPNQEELTVAFNQALQEALRDHMNILHKDFWFNKPEEVAEIVKATLGMTVYEASIVYRLCLASTNSIHSTVKDMLAIVHQQRNMSIQKSTVLQLIPREELPSIAYIGGLDDIISFLTIRANAFSEQAKEQKIELPKGIVLTGITGTGKSTVAKAAGRVLGLPVILLNMGSIFNSYVGVSESRIKQELARIDALNGSVLIIDEADKALAGATNDSSTDGGVSMRVFGTILTWLQERKSRTFVILTMNNTKLLPTEIFRAGRFDRVFSIGLPSAKERRAILESHLRKRDLHVAIPEEYWTKIIRLTNNFVGAELESVVIDSRYLAFNRRGTGVPTVYEIMEVLQNRKPIYKSDIGAHSYSGCIYTE